MPPQQPFSSIQGKSARRSLESISIWAIVVTLIVAVFIFFPLSMVTLEDVKAALGTQTVMMDVRDVDEWIGDSSSPYGKDYAPRKGRLPGAKWVEWYRFMKPSAQGPIFKSPDEVLAECATAGIAPTDEIYLYSFKGARASNTFLALTQAGFQNVRMYFGSWNEWSRDPGLPIESGLPRAGEVTA